MTLTFDLEPREHCHKNSTGNTAEPCEVTRLNDIDYTSVASLPSGEVTGYPDYPLPG